MARVPLRTLGGKISGSWEMLPIASWLAHHRPRLASRCRETLSQPRPLPHGVRQRRVRLPPGGTRGACMATIEINRARFVLIDMQNWKFGPCSATTDRVLVPAMGHTSTSQMRSSLQRVTGRRTGGRVGRRTDRLGQNRRAHHAEARRPEHGAGREWRGADAAQLP
jgi:hypothetical protein